LPIYKRIVANRKGMMMRDNNIVEHPKRALMTEAKIERALSDSPEAEALQEDILRAVRAYVDFLDRHNRIWEDGSDDPDAPPRLKAQALVVTADFGDGDNAIDISLKDGPLDRVYGEGVNPDPWGREG
jgi:hypothetical protein